MSQHYIPDRAMFIFAHPDDIEFGVAGTAVKWARGGCENSYVIITDGNAGTHDRALTREQLAEMRRAEQSAAAKVAGAKRCIYLGYDDGLLAPTLQLRKQLVRLIRQYQPNVVVCGDPTAVLSGGRINHPDHRAAATAAIDAIFPASEMHLLYSELEEEGIMPHRVNYVYISTFTDPDFYVDISSTIDTKLAALREHKSQLADWDPEERIRQRGEQVGKQVGLKYAEGFRRVTLQAVVIEEEPELEATVATSE
jgi:LmbE family N-acetylglucosaminyl deacetylase